MEYIHSLPSHVEVIDLASKGLTELPDLSRFYKLKTLNCSCNKLIYIPIIPTLTRLYCSFNELTSIPVLPELICLHCINNKLTHIPPLFNLKYLCCSNNKISHIPILPNLNSLLCSFNEILIMPVLPNLNEICCGSNPICNIIDINTTMRYHLTTASIAEEFNYKNSQLHRFRELFYALKYKTVLKRILWDRVRRPKIEAQYHPTQLVQFIQEHPEDWDQRLDEW